MSGVVHQIARFLGKNTDMQPYYQTVEFAADKQIASFVFFGCEKRENIIGICLDVAFFVLYAIACVYLAFRWNFPWVRGYMWIGYALGGVLYCKTLRRILAFLEKVCYNKLAKVAKKAKIKKKLGQERDL